MLIYTGSISENRVTVGLPPTVRDELMTDARRHGIKVPELIRHMLLGWYKDRMEQRETVLRNGGK